MRSAKKRIILAILGIILLSVLPFLSGPYYTHIFILVFINITLAVGYRLLFVTGLASFCHITFYGIGAYTSALLSTRLGFPFLPSFLAAGLASAAAAILLGWQAVRIRGPYFFLISFAFWAVIDSVFKHWRSLTGGPNGIHGIPLILGIANVVFYYYVTILFSAVSVFFMYRLDRSRFGFNLLAIGDADDLTELLGINVVMHRVLAFSIGALFAGFAGSIYASYAGFIAPSSFSLWSTLYIFVWTVIGGERKIWGPMLGAALLTLIAESLRMSGILQATLYGVILVIVVLVAPHGIVGLFNDIKSKRGTVL